MIPTNVLLVFILCAGGVLGQEENKPTQNDETHNSGREPYNDKQTRDYVERHCFVECKQDTKPYMEDKCICDVGYYRKRMNEKDDSLNYCHSCTICSSDKGNPYVGRSCDCGHNTYCCPEENMDVVKKDGHKHCQRKLKSTSSPPIHNNPPCESPSREYAAMEERLSVRLENIEKYSEEIMSEMKDKFAGMDDKLSCTKEKESSSDTMLKWTVCLSVTLVIFHMFYISYSLWARISANRGRNVSGQRNGGLMDDDSGPREA